MRTLLLVTDVPSLDLLARAWTLGNPLSRAWLLAGQKKKAEKIASTFKFILQMYAKKQKFILFRRKKLINFKKQLDPSANLPVLVFFHGGAFSTGSSRLYGGNKFMDHDIVLVVPHYRLGPLGKNLKFIFESIAF